ncbi:hypothetical protein CS387_09005 [Porphyromonas gingivalis]|nr:hypothetical protein CS387_09005 [Porphyromonas gingivalis]
MPWETSCHSLSIGCYKHFLNIKSLILYRLEKEFDRLNIFSNFGTLSITFIIGNHVSGHRSKENHLRGRLHTKSFFALFPFEIPSNPYCRR